MRKLILTIIIFGASLNSFSQVAPSRLNLNQCIEIALKNNVDVQRSALSSENARIDLKQSRTDLLPEINAGIGHSLSQGRSIDPLTNTYVTQQVVSASPYLNGSLLLFNGMAMQNLIRKNALAYQATKQDEQRIRDDLTLQVTLTYLQVLTYQDIAGLAKAQLETTARQLERLDILNTNGNIAPANYYDTKGQYANDKLNIINTGNTLEEYKISLSKLLNIPYSKAIQLDPLNGDQFSLIYETSPDQVYQQAEENLAVVKAADLRKQSAAMMVKAARSGFYPQVYFNTGLSSNFSNAARDAFNQRIGYFNQFNNNLGKSYSIGISIPIFNSFRTKNQVSRAKLTLRDNELLAQSTRTQLQQLIEEAYLNMTSSRERYLSLKEQAEAYTEAFRTIEIRFNAGVINSVDYLVAKDKMDRANVDILTNRYDFILRKKILDFYQGKPLGL